MQTGNRIYHRTEAGERALQRSERPFAGLRTVLASVGEATHFDALQARLSGCSKSTLLRSLDALEKRGFIESVAMEWLRQLDRLGCYEPAALRRRTAPARSS